MGQLGRLERCVGSDKVVLALSWVSLEVCASVGLQWSDEMLWEIERVVDRGTGGVEYLRCGYAGSLEGFTV